MKSQLIKRLKYVETGKNDTQRTKTSCTNPIKLATGGNEKIVAKCTLLGLLQCPRDDGRRGVCSVRRVHIFLAPRYSQPDTLQNNLVNCIQTASFITRFQPGNSLALCYLRAMRVYPARPSTIAAV